MTAIGFALFVIGWLLAMAIEPERYTWDWRDAVTTAPICLGLLLIVAGIVRWLWQVMP